jgi:hypothetical protein
MAGMQRAGVGRTPGAEPMQMTKVSFAQEQRRAGEDEDEDDDEALWMRTVAQIKGLKIAQPLEFLRMNLPEGRFFAK